MSNYTSLAISNPSELLFGISPRPLTTRHGLVIGGGQVYPELNFTLPPMAVEASTMPAVLDEYRQIINGATKRAIELECDGLVVEFELLPPMTIEPQWGIDVTRVLVDALEGARAKSGLRSTLRVTPTDIREFAKPPTIRSGRYWESLVRSFDGCAAAGAELLSIESVGGKEVHDEALTMGDLPAVIFGLCVMGVRDMRHLWTEIAKTAARHRAIAAGDTACGFGNTAMVLAEQKMISRTFAAVVRAITAVRSLVAYECGAVGPGKDCGYENVFLKAITGYPMAMEGKTAACAHLSPVGNVAAAMCDTWSNESVQNLKLLGGMAPTCYLEQLVYDCRLMNEALKDGRDAALTLRNWMVRSDVSLDPQAYVLSPACAVEIASAIVSAKNPYDAGCAAARAAINLLRRGVEAGELKLSPMERPWLDTMQASLDELPDSESAFISQMMGQVDTTRFMASEYGL